MRVTACSLDKQHLEKRVWCLGRKLVLGGHCVCVAEGDSETTSKVMKYNTTNLNKRSGGATWGLWGVRDWGEARTLQGGSDSPVVLPGSMCALRRAREAAIRGEGLSWGGTESPLRVLPTHHHTGSWATEPLRPSRPSLPRPPRLPSLLVWLPVAPSDSSPARPLFRERLLVLLLPCS